MSKKELESKVVELKFDNSEFDKNVDTSIKSIDKLEDKLEFKDAGKGFKNIEEAADKVDLSSLGAAFENIGSKISAMEVAGIASIANLTNKAVDAGLQLAKSLSVDQIEAGYGKYTSKTSSVQTLINAGYELDEVNEVLEQLMWYSDETSYGFTDMTAALATAASQGLEIKEMIPVIEGMANATAYAGKGASEFSRVIFNLMQSFGTGSLQLIDWKSVNLAGVSSEQLKQSIIDAAEAMGTVEKGAITVANFEDTLSTGWATTDVMMKAFGSWADFTQAVYEAKDDYDTTADAMEALSSQYDGYSRAALEAAQTAKTFEEAIEATKDAVSTGWLESFEIIFGNYEEAKVLWTDLANALWDAFAAGGETRNNLLKEWKELNGRDTLIDAFWEFWDIATLVINSVTEAFNKVFPLPTAQKLFDITKSIFDTLSNLKTKLESDNSVLKDFTRILSGALGVVKLVGNTFKGVWGSISFLIDRINTPLKSVTSGLGAIGKYITSLSNKLSTLNAPYRILMSLTKSVLYPIARTLQSISRFISTLIFGPFKNLFKLTTPGLATMNKSITNVEEKIKAFGKVIRPALNTISKFFNTMTNWVSDFYSSFGRNFGKVGSILTQFGHLVSQIAKQVYDAFIAPIISKLSFIGDAFSNAFENVKTAIQPAIDKLKSFRDGADATKNIADTIYVAIGNLYRIFTGFSVKLRETNISWSNLLDQFKDSAFAQFWTKLWTDSISPFFENIKNGAENAFNYVKDSVTRIFSKDSKIDKETSNFGKSVVTNLGENVNKAWEEHKPNTEGIQSNFEKFAVKMREIWEKVKPAFDSIAKGFGSFFSKLGEYFKTLQPGDITKLINLLIAGGIVKKLKDFAESLTEITKPFTNALDGIVKSIAAISKKIEMQINVKAFQTIAIALLILTIAVSALAFLPVDKTRNAITALAEIAIIMAGVLKFINGMNKDAVAAGKNAKTTKTATSSLIELSVSLLIIAFAMQKLGSIEPDRLDASVNAVASIIMILAIMVKTFSKETKVLTKGEKQSNIVGKAMLELAFSIFVIALALRELDKIEDLDKSQKSIALIGEVMIVMVTVFKQLKGVDNAIKTASAVFLLTLALIPIALGIAAIMLLLKWDTGVAWEAAGFLAAIISALLLSLKSVSGVEKAIQAAIAVDIMVLALLPVIASIAALAILWNKAGGIAMVAAWGIFTLLLFSITASLVYLDKNTKNAIKTATSLVIMAVAMNLMALSLIPMVGSLSAVALLMNKVGLATMLQSFGILGLIVLTLTASLLAVDKYAKNAMESATAMLVLAASLIPMVTALSILSKLPFKAVMGGVLVITALFAVILGITVAVDKLHLSDTIVRIAASFLVFSTSALILSIALNLIAVAMLRFIEVIGAFALMSGTILTLAAANILLFAKTIIDNLAPVADSLINFLVTLFGGLSKKLLPAITDFIHTLTMSLVQMLLIDWPVLVLTLRTFLSGIFDLFRGFIPPLLQIVGEVITGVLSLIYDTKEKIAMTLIGLFVAVLSELALHSEEWGPALGEIIWGVILAALSVVENFFIYVDEHIGEWLDRIWNIIQQVLNFLVDKAPDFVTTGITLILKLIEGFEEKFGDIIQMGADIILNLINGVNDAIKNNKDSFIQAIDDFIYNIWDVLLSAFENWPVLMERIGRRILFGDENGKGGLVSGIAKVWPRVKTFATNLWNGVVEWFAKIKEKFLNWGKEAIQNLKDGIKNKAAELGDAIKGVGTNIKEGWEKFWGINSPSKVMQEEGEYWVDGFAKGIDDNSSDAMDSIDDLGDDALDKMHLTMKALNDAIDEDMDINPTITPVMDMTNIQNGAKEMDNMFGDYRTGVDVGKTTTRTGSLANSINRDQIDKASNAFANDTKSFNSSTVNNFTINNASDPDAVADRVSKILQRQVDRRNATWA